MLELDGVSKRYGARVALAPLSLGVAVGEVVGLVGPNGAGKTTLLRLAVGYLDPDEGRVRIDGIDLAHDRSAAQARLGYLPELAPLPPELTVEGFLRHRAGLKGAGAAAVASAVEVADVSAVRHQVIGTLSKGYRQRVALADAVLGTPPLLVLDEPGSGMDPLAARALREQLRRVARDRAVLLSSHALGELAVLADRVAVLRAGELIAVATPAELCRAQGKDALDDAIVALLATAPGARA